LETGSSGSQRFEAWLEFHDVRGDDVELSSQDCQRSLNVIQIACRPDKSSVNFARLFRNRLKPIGERPQFFGDAFAVAGNQPFDLLQESGQPISPVCSGFGSLSKVRLRRDASSIDGLLGSGKLRLSELEPIDHDHGETGPTSSSSTSTGEGFRGSCSHRWSPQGS
jgi:hypothetical protein